MIVANSKPVTASSPIRPFVKPVRDDFDRNMIDMENRFLSDDEDDDDDEGLPGPPINRPVYHNPRFSDVLQVNNCQTISGVHVQVI